MNNLQNMFKNDINPFLATDGYKTAHHNMYPDRTELVLSNWTARHGKHSNIKNSKGVIVVGASMVFQKIVEMFDKTFFFTDRRDAINNLNIDEPTKSKLLINLRDEACLPIKHVYSAYLGFNYDISHIEELWDYGKLPVKVKTIREGHFVNYGVPSLTIHNVGKQFFWVTNFLETLISNMLWMPMTAATTAFEYKKILTKYAKETDIDNLDFVSFQGHNFSMRGMAGLDATVSAGIGHASSFMGDDSLPTIYAAYKYYKETAMPVFGVPASEHSVMCSGTKDDELGTFRHLMKQYPTGILSIVSDTWNLWDVLTKYLPILKDEILARDGKIVIRPDSGDPVDIICGTYTGTDYVKLQNRKNWTPQEKGLIELLWDLFGGTINSQGYKVLDPHIGAIYGDSITLERADRICDRLKAKGFATTNIVLGIGSYTYQYVTRDTHGFAMKATYVEVNGDGREIFKDPITGDGTKKSAKGLISVKLENGKYVLNDQCTFEDMENDDMLVLFNDGKFVYQPSLVEIRLEINKQI
jgi:nicotinamide phosphoribosyltransferase